MEKSSLKNKEPKLFNVALMPVLNKVFMTLPRMTCDNKTERVNDSFRQILIVTLYLPI